MTEEGVEAASTKLPAGDGGDGQRAASWDERKDEREEGARGRQLRARKEPVTYNEAQSWNALLTTAAQEKAFEAIPKEREKAEREKVKKERSAAAQAERGAASPDTEAKAEAPRRGVPEVVRGGDEELDSHTAWSVGFPPDALSEEEEGLLPPGADEAAYCKVRNAVLSLWRKDVSRPLSQAAAVATVRPSLGPLARLAWRFLDALGYINFGCGADPSRGGAATVAEAHWDANTRAGEDDVSADAAAGPDNDAEGGRARGTGAEGPTSPSCGPKEGTSAGAGTGESNAQTVIVIGAGLAGLGAARQLAKMDYRVIVLEGRDRSGGRVYSKKIKGGDGAAAVGDLGGSIITGIDGNPLAVLAKQLGIPLHDLDGHDTQLYTDTGEQMDEDLDKKVDRMHNAILDAASRHRNEFGEIAAHISLKSAIDTLLEDADEEVEGGALLKESNANQLMGWHMANLEFANAARLSTLSMKHWDQDDVYEMPGRHCFLPGGNVRLVAALAEGLPIMYNNAVHEIAYGADGVAVTTNQGRFLADAVLCTVPLGVLQGGDVAFSPPLPPRKRGAIARLGFGLLNKVVLLFPHTWWDDHVDMFGRIASDQERTGEFFLFYAYHHISGGALLAGLIAGKAAAEYETLSTAEAASRAMAALRRMLPKTSIPAPIGACLTKWGEDPFARGSYSSMAVGCAGGADYDLVAESVADRVFFAGEATTRKYPATMHGAYASGLREAANIDATLRWASSKRTREDAEEGGDETSQATTQRKAEEAKEVLSRLTGAISVLMELFSPAAPPPDEEFGPIAVINGPRAGVFADSSLIKVDTRGVPLFAVVESDQLSALREQPTEEACITVLTTVLGIKWAGRPVLDEDVCLFLEDLEKHADRMMG